MRLREGAADHAGMTTEIRPGVRPQARTVRKREAITGAALALFLEHTYARTTMDDICARAGCSKGGLYHHFRTKEAVLESVVARLATTGALLPPVTDAARAMGVASAQLEALLVEIWAEASRASALWDTLANHAPSSLAGIVAVGELVGRVARAEGEEIAERRAA